MTTDHSGAFAGVRQPLPRASHAPGEIYASPEIFRREMDDIFLQDWLYIGRVEELAERYDYMALRLVGQPVIVARDKDGELHASYNMCAHRGVEVASGSGNTKSFKCPYHGWVYDHSGQLTGAAYTKDLEGFDVADCRLKPVQLEVWRGNIFINFSDHPQPFADFIAEFEKDFAFLRMDDCRLGNKMELEVACNWKFIPENLMDFYHVGVLHAGSFGKRFSWTEDNVQLKDKGGISLFYQAGPLTPGGEPLLGKMPWLEDEDYTFACTGFLPPNLTMFGRIECSRFIVTWPLDVDRTKVIIYQLYPEEFHSRPDFAEKMKIYRDFNLFVLEEDQSMIESMQRAMSSPVYQPGRFADLEKGLHHFLNGYLDRMFGDSHDGDSKDGENQIREAAE